MTAMTAATLDQLSDGRLLLGIGIVRPAGRRGLARRSASPSSCSAPASTSRSSAWRCARARRVPRRDDRAPAARRPRQGAEADDRAGAGAHPDLPRRDRAEEHGAGGRDRRRVAADAVLARAPARSARVLEDGAARAGRSARGLRHRADRERGVTDDIAPRATPCARSSRCTSAAWARASRTSTTSSSPLRLRGRGPRRSRTSTSTGKHGRGDGRHPRRADRQGRARAGRSDVVRERLRAYRDAGVGTLACRPMAFDARRSALEQLRLVAELAG